MVKVVEYKNQAQFEYLSEFYTDAQINQYCNGSDERLSDLWQLTQPQDVEISSLLDANSGSRYLVDSPDGWVPVLECVHKDPKKIYSVFTDNGFVVNASEDHLFQNTNEDWIYTNDLKVGEILITKIGPGIVTNKVDYGHSEVFDLSVDHKNHRYYTGGICSHNTGKSLFLQNLALNWVQMGLSVIYITMELSEELVGLRYDAMIAETPTKMIFKDIEGVAMRLGMMRKTGGKTNKWGKLQIKKLPMAGTTTNDIRAYLQEFEVQTGAKPDAVVVDYLDLMHPNSGKINVSDQFIKDKFTSEELRALAVEWNILCATASQLNRASIQEQDFDASHIAGGISKINTADNVLAILTTTAMKERGEYQIQFLKTRSSSGVGQRIFLKIDPNTLRIEDAPQEMAEGRSGGMSPMAASLAAGKTSIVPKSVGTSYAPDKGPTGPAAENPILQRAVPPAPSDGTRVQASGASLRALAMKNRD